MRHRRTQAAGLVAALSLLMGLSPTAPARSAAGTSRTAGPCMGPGQAAPPDAPSPRRSAALADDPDHGQVVLFGGWNGSRSLGDTWTWDGTEWTQRQPVDSPLPRYGAGMTYDAARGQVVLFGGSDDVHSLTDTWIWDGANWVEQHPDHSPFAGANQLAFDARNQNVVMNEDWIDIYTNWTWDGTDWQSVVRGEWDGRDLATMSRTKDRVMLYGGGREVFEDIFPTRGTWLWDGSTWRFTKPRTKPSAAYQAGMAYDEARDRVVLFGGWLQPKTFAETWTWDGENWTLMHPATSPKPRKLIRMTYDSTRREVIVFGGTRGDETCYFGDTWTWDGVTWTEH
jgi:hypothetical protein